MVIIVTLWPIYKKRDMGPGDPRKYNGDTSRVSQHDRVGSLLACDLEDRGPDLSCAKNVCSFMKPSFFNFDPVDH
jgi:hypothetical protein